MDTASITGLILAGGRGSRMGGVDKGLQILNGKPMVAHVIERLAPQVQGMMIVANQNPEAYQSFGYPVWPDSLAGFAGPLAGLQEGLSHCATPWLVTAPCDSPFLPADLVGRLGDAVVAAAADLAVAVTGSGDCRQPHPVFCLLQTALLPHLNAYLQEGGRKFDAWYRSLHVVEVEFPNEMAFRNINTLEELQRYQAQ
ncbi:molybdenum cofactor guanylyltransferase MobA [Noviherbaspirillum sedimenti]|uniref:Molybdenum cofactor guanylyltransferase n=1 Tax=Noviherbaspirillum sedimenti TaxID=2320865 RepID=A0A3A3FW39_9BURK|nr:molybdenum cofactor guanylyltransferase MobA [Noviherbaspirillum sedimenti]RJG00367.1 molybdenum cofactor guanylyltransferase MobA [Noviherbaspirillum sedimenti]